MLREEGSTADACVTRQGQATCNVLMTRCVVDPRSHMHRHIEQSSTWTIRKVARDGIQTSVAVVK